jgi:hypothetical protein
VWAHWYEGGFEKIIAAVGDPGASDGAATTMPVFLLLRDGAIRREALDVLERLVAATPEHGTGTGTEGRAESRGAAGGDGATRGDGAAGGEGGGVRTPVRDRVRSISRGLAYADQRRGRPEPWRRGLGWDAVDLLAGHRLYLPQAVEIAVSLLDVRTDSDEDLDAAAFADDLCAIADLLGDRPVLAARTARNGIDRLHGYSRVDRSDPALLLPAANRLADRSDLAAGLLAVALTRIAGHRTEWAPEWRRILLRLRASPHVEVAQEAWDLPGG